MQSADATSRNLSFVLILIGVVLRIVYYFVDTAFWRDEVYIALSVSERSYAQLMLPLDYYQSAPLGFLFLEKTIYELAGRSELALRLPSLIASIAALPLFYALVRKVSPKAVNFALVLFAISPNLVGYGAELKPYAGDVLATILVLLSGLYIYERETDRRLTAAFAAMGCLLVWCSTPVVFVLFGTGATLIVAEFWRGAKKKAFILVAVSLAWLTSFSVYFFTIARHALDNVYLVDFWKSAYVPLIPTSGEQREQLFRLLTGPFTHPLALWDYQMPPNLSFLLFIPCILLMLGWAGMLAAKGRCRVVASSCVLMLLATLVASSCHTYPFAGRLILFLVPTVILSISWAVTNVRYLRTMPFTIVLLLFLSTFHLNAMAGRFTMKRSEARDLCDQLAFEIQQGDAFYVHDSGGRTFHWYSQKLPLDRGLVFYPGKEQLIPESELTEWNADEMCQHDRVWLVFPEIHGSVAIHDLQRLYGEMFQHRGQPAFMIELQTAAAFLFESLDEESRKDD